MNKYKMISICSLTIACVLMLSILLPIRANANEKESIELSMHYEKSKVTANIIVNSEVYTGVVCKYLIIDDVLKYDDILAQTRDNGTTISLDKSEDDKYTTEITDVNKRYVVIYVSIGNCSLCDYIDCNPNGDSADEKHENSSEEEPNPNIDVTGEEINDKPAEAIEESKPEEQQENNKPAEENNQVEEIPAEENKPEEVVVQEEPVKEDNNNEQPANENKPVENNADNLVVDSSENKEPAIQEIPYDAPSNNDNTQNNKPASNNNKPATNSNDKDSIDVSNKDNNKNNVTSSGNNGTVDTKDFEEIEKVISSSTSDEKMPQTGENDFAKILGIIVFSTVSVVSFYKYKTTK